MRQPVPLDRLNVKEPCPHLRLVGRMVEGNARACDCILREVASRVPNEFAFVPPIGPLYVQVEHVDLGVGNERHDCSLVKAAILRCIRLKHCKDVTTLTHRTKEFLERVLLLKVLRCAEDEDALALVHFGRARAAFEICAHQNLRWVVVDATPRRGLKMGARDSPSTSRNVRQLGRHSKSRAFTMRMRS
jgi:hypothetical protein